MPPSRQPCCGPPPPWSGLSLSNLFGAHSGRPEGPTAPKRGVDIYLLPRRDRPPPSLTSCCAFLIRESSGGLVLMGQKSWEDSAGPSTLFCCSRHELLLWVPPSEPFWGRGRQETKNFFGLFGSEGSGRPLPRLSCPAAQALGRGWGASHPRPFGLQGPAQQAGREAFSGWDASEKRGLRRLPGSLLWS